MLTRAVGSALDTTKCQLISIWHSQFQLSPHSTPVAKGIIHQLMYKQNALHDRQTWMRDKIVDDVTLTKHMNELKCRAIVIIDWQHDSTFDIIVRVSTLCCDVTLTVKH